LPRRRRRRRSRKTAPVTIPPFEIRKYVKRMASLVLIVFASIFMAIIVMPGVGIFRYDKMMSVEDSIIDIGTSTSTSVSSSIRYNDGNVADIYASKIADPMTYNATYSFTNETEGKKDVSGWTTSHGFDSPTVVSSIDNHSKIINVQNSTISRNAYCSRGMIEFWFYVYENTTDDVLMTVESDTGFLFLVKSKGTNSNHVNISLYNVTTPIVFKSIGEPDVKKWTRMCILFDSSLDGIYASLDDVQSPIFLVKEFSRLTRISFNDSNVMLDAIGLSWESYAPGSNRYPLKQYAASLRIYFSNTPSIIERCIATTIRITSTDPITTKESAYFKVNLPGGDVLVEDICDTISFNDNEITFTFGDRKDLIWEGKILIIMQFQDDSDISITLESIEVTFSVIL
jgi:hypothetical protein